MVTKKGSPAWKAKLSKAQKKGWKKRKAELKYKGAAKSTMSGPKTSAQNIPREELDATRWVNAADTPKERHLRKAAMHSALYASGSGSLLEVCEGLRAWMLKYEAEKEQLAKEGIKTEKWTVASKSFNPDEFLVKDKEAVESGSNPKTLMGAQKVPVLSVIPAASIIAQGTAMRYGAFFAPRVDGSRGYGPYNWRDQPIEAHIYVDAAMRHLMQWFDGEDAELIQDDEGNRIDTVSHLAFALATIGILLDAQANDTLIDDRPKVRKHAATIMLSQHKIKIKDSTK